MVYFDKTFVNVKCQCHCVCLVYLLSDKIKTYNVKRRFKIYKFTKFTLQN